MTNEQPFFQEMEAQETALLPQNFKQRLHLANGKVSCFFMKVMLQPHITQYPQNIVLFDLKKCLDIIALTHDIYVNKLLFGLCTFISQNTWEIPGSSVMCILDIPGHCVIRFGFCTLNFSTSENKSVMHFSDL